MAAGQYVQKPYKVLAEQFTGILPPDAATRSGLCICTAHPFPDGRPHVHGRTQCYEVHPTDWVCQELWSPHDWFVVPDAEFLDRF
jgi:hypothetical protein